MCEYTEIEDDDDEHIDERKLQTVATVIHIIKKFIVSEASFKMRTKLWLLKTFYIICLFCLASLEIKKTSQHISFMHFSYWNYSFFLASTWILISNDIRSESDILIRAVKYVSLLLESKKSIQIMILFK